MDCNSYSYTPHMLDDEQRIEQYYNDDMEAELTKNGSVYCVWAFSFDGSMDVYEEFSDKEQAEQLYDFIVENYNDTPHGDELDEYIDNLRRKSA